MAFLCAPGGSISRPCAARPTTGPDCPLRLLIDAIEPTISDQIGFEGSLNCYHSESGCMSDLRKEL